MGWSKLCLSPRREMVDELNDTEKEALLGTVIDRARADLNDGRPLTEMRRDTETKSYTADLDPLDVGLMPFTISFLGDDEDQPWKIDCDEVNDTHETLDQLLFWNLILGTRFISEQ